MIDLEEKLKKYNQEQIIVEIEKMNKEEQEKIAKQTRNKIRLERP